MFLITQTREFRWFSLLLEVLTVSPHLLLQCSIWTSKANSSRHFAKENTDNQLDRTALNYAKVFGMEKAMGLKGNQFSVAASISLVSMTSKIPERIRKPNHTNGLQPAQAPWAYLIGRYPAGRVLGVSTLIWGLAVITMVFNRNYAGVLVSRFVLGVFEASVTPGLSLMTGFWYTRAEMPLRVSSAHGPLNPMLITFILSKQSGTPVLDGEE
jgi:MFS family permease